MTDLITVRSPTQYSVKEIAMSVGAVVAYDTQYLKQELKSPFVYKRAGLQAASAYLGDKGVDFVNTTFQDSKMTVDSRVMALPISCGALFAGGCKVANVQGSGGVLWDFLAGAGSCAAAGTVNRAVLKA